MASFLDDLVGINYRLLHQIYGNLPYRSIVRRDLPQSTGNNPFPGPIRRATPPWKDLFVNEDYLTTPEMNPARRRGGLISFFRKQRASRPT
jgi:hypothetical protein